MLLDRTIKENVREDRDVYQLPVMEPLGNDKFWDFKIFPKTYKNWEQMNKKDKIVAGIFLSIHAMALLAPFTYSSTALGWFFISYMVAVPGITLGYHRLLTHKSFSSPKWFEYLIAFIGVLSVQGDPIEWCSAHRYHHAHCDDVADPHSPYDGFFWSHMGWMLDSKGT
jgi:stearoyl-CoA desaturase (Delta-9 desaturase)